MGFLSFFKASKEDIFISLLVDQAEKTVEGIRVLEACLATPGPESVARVKVVESEADEIRRILIDELHRSFITPLDREDIFDLSLHLDEMVDYALTTVEEMDLLGVSSDGYLTSMVALVLREAEELALATRRLIANPLVAGDHARRANKLESEVDRLYRTAVADLLSQVGDVPQLTAALRRREVYRHVSNMSDRADTAANTFGIVVMKLT